MYLIMLEASHSSHHGFLDNPSRGFFMLAGFSRHIRLLPCPELQLMRRD
jgi:hypothetical protein